VQLGLLPQCFDTPSNNVNIEQELPRKRYSPTLQLSTHFQSYSHKLLPWYDFFMSFKIQEFWYVHGESVVIVAELEGKGLV
jgi:hypothetical protein